MRSGPSAACLQKNNCIPPVKAPALLGVEAFLFFGPLISDVGAPSRQTTEEACAYISEGSQAG